MLLTPFAADSKDEKLQTSFLNMKRNIKIHQTSLQLMLMMQFMQSKAALEEANATPDMSASDICDLLKDAITKVNIDGATGSGMTWSATGEVNKDPKAVVIQNGEYVGM